MDINRRNRNVNIKHRLHTNCVFGKLPTKLAYFESSVFIRCFKYIMIQYLQKHLIDIIGLHIVYSRIRERVKSAYERNR